MLKRIDLTSIFLVVILITVGSLTALGQDLVIQNITVVDVETGSLSENRTVIISGEFIESIIPAGNNNTYPNETIIIDGTGQYLAPGFVNTHIHIAIGTVGFNMSGGTPKLEMEILAEVPEYTLPLLLANGITTARDPGGKTEVTTSIKKQLQNGKLTGPELFVAGAIIDTTSFKNLVDQIETKEDISKAIAKQQREGVDYIKLYTSLNPELLEYGIDEAHKMGLETIAHLQNTSWTEAAKRGLDNIVHIIPGNERLLPERYRNEFTQSVATGSQWMYKWFEYADLNSPEINELINTLKKFNVSVDPTLVLFHSVFFANRGTYQQNPKLKYVPDPMVENWKTFNFNVGWSEEDYRRANAVWNKVEKFTKMLHTNGVLLTAGTDNNNPWIPAGESFHHELELLAESGIPDSDVLKIATINGAKMLGIDHRIGTVHEGKEADLVILNRNPLDDISNTRHIELTIMNGLVYTPEELENNLK